jgi:hypothetical protein
MKRLGMRYSHLRANVLTMVRDIVCCVTVLRMSENNSQYTDLKTVLQIVIVRCNNNEPSPAYNHRKRGSMSEVIQALRMISERDPQGIPCGPNAPEDCECGCIGCIARAALKKQLVTEPNRHQRGKQLYTYNAVIAAEGDDNRQSIRNL